MGAMLFSAVASADEAALRFKGGIGVIPVSSFVNCPATNPCAIPGTGAAPVAVNRNIVRGVPPPGQIWVIDDLDARIGPKGNIVVRGKGLILAGGDNTGRAPTPALSVFASLFCGAPTAATESRTASVGVVLPPDGDFEIHDVLSPVPAREPRISSGGRADKQHRVVASRWPESSQTIIELQVSATCA